MALDVHVMPFWKWWAGQYTAPVERICGSSVRRVGRPKEMMSVAEAQQQDDAIHEAYCHIFDTASIWDASAASVFSEQFGDRALHATRAYAAFLDHPPRKGLFWRTVDAFTPGVDPSGHPSLVKVCNGAKTQSPHLIRHQDNAGWYLPIEFPSDFSQPIPPAFGLPSAGSSVALLAELQRLASRLEISFTWDQLARGEYALDENDILYDVLYGVAFLTHVAQLSIKHRLPVILDG